MVGALRSTGAGLLRNYPLDIVFVVPIACHDYGFGTVVN